MVRKWEICDNMWQVCARGENMLLIAVPLKILEENKQICQADISGKRPPRTNGASPHCRSLEAFLSHSGPTQSPVHWQELDGCELLQWQLECPSPLPRSACPSYCGRERGAHLCCSRRVYSKACDIYPGKQPGGETLIVSRSCTSISRSHHLVATHETAYRRSAQHLLCILGFLRRAWQCQRILALNGRQKILQRVGQNQGEMTKRFAKFVGDWKYIPPT